jgi:Flp pilus assembly pilin Flp
VTIFALATWLRARFAREERGASLVEYLLLVSLIAMAVIGAVIFLGSALNDAYENAGSRLSTP